MSTAAHSWRAEHLTTTEPTPAGDRAGGRSSCATKAVQVVMGRSHTARCPASRLPGESKASAGGGTAGQGYAVVVAGRTFTMSRREEMSSLEKTLRRCHSTVWGLRKRRVPISGLVMPWPARRAICSSCAVSTG